jgi:hypothetical protein
MDATAKNFNLKEMDLLSWLAELVLQKKRSK